MVGPCTFHVQPHVRMEECKMDPRPGECLGLPASVISLCGGLGGDAGAEATEYFMS